MRYGYIRIPIEEWLALFFITATLYLLFRLFRFGEEKQTWNHDYFFNAMIFAMPLWIAGQVCSMISVALQIVVWILVMLISFSCLIRVFRFGFLKSIFLSLAIVPVGVVAHPVGLMIVEKMKT